MTEATTTNTTVENLSGSIERVTYHSEETGFCVLKVKVKGQRELVTVVGNSVSVGPGEFIDCSGVWVSNREYGLQFRAEQLRIAMPSTIEGIEKYLSSGLVKGIGPHFAKQLVAAFGLQVFDLIDREPDRLMELPGIGQSRRDSVIESWQDQKVIREIIVFLQSYGVGTARAVRIYKTYGKEAISKVRENPYRLALDIRGIGFKTADALADRLGVPKQSLMRAGAGVRHCLQENCNDGNCAMLVEELIDATIKLLEIPEDIIIEAIQQEKNENRIIEESIDGTPALFLAALHRSEVGVVQNLKRLLYHKTVWHGAIETRAAIPWVEQKTGLELSVTQKEAIDLVLHNKVVIITGGPGVGKTTLVNSILKIVQTKTSKILLCAPTGRAAKRLSESTGIEAKTLHRLLEFDPQNFGFKRNENSTLEADLIVVDEISMVDITMMHNLLKAIPDTAGIILVGDVDQLPSVGPGAVLANLIESGEIPTVCLTQIFRQAKSSQIIVNAHRINQGYLPNMEAADPKVLTDFYFVDAETPELIHEKLMQLVIERIPYRFGLDPIRQIQVLVPMNRGGLGVRALNGDLQQRLNPEGRNRIMRFGSSFTEGDKVIQTVNNYKKEVFNGDIGFITEIDLEMSIVRILFEGRLVEYEMSELDEIMLAYATTIHKSQGSEYPAVVMPIATQHYMLLERNLLYTGVTRGKSLVVIIGQKKALGMAVRTVRSSKRLTNLTARLSGPTVL